MLSSKRSVNFVLYNMALTLAITASLKIPLSEIRFQFARGSGPGGQNVNKVETRVELHFDVVHSPTLGDKERERILKNLSSKITDEGILRIVSQESRSQWKNREHALNKFIALMAKAVAIRKKRRKTGRPAAANESRLEEKKRRGKLKRQRKELPF